MTVNTRYFSTQFAVTTNKSLTVGWFWQAKRGLTITAEASYTDNKSDIQLFDYSRFRYQACFRYQF